MTDLIPAARPVPSPEDRMRDARTDTPPTIDPAPTHPGRSFRTWMSDTDRDQLDARAAAAEQERDEALDDRDEARASLRDAMAELRDRTRDWREALDARNVLRAQLDAIRAELTDAHAYLTRRGLDDVAQVRLLAEQRDAAKAERDQARQVAGIATDVLATIRDAAERIDRALAVYDTTPEPGSVTITLDNSKGTFTPRHPGDALADALRNAYSTEQLAALHEELVHELDDDAPQENPLGRLVDALFAARWHQQPPSSVPPRRAQEPSAADVLRQAAAGRREYAKAIPEKAEPLDLQAHTLEAAARVVEGDLSPLYDWLPSWQWTDEMNAQLHPAARAINERTPRP